MIGALQKNKAVSSGSGNNLQQTINILSNKTYKLTFDVISTSGTLGFDLGGATAKTLTDSGSKEYYFQSVNTNNLRFYGSNYYGSITNISVIEITDDTNLPRINYEGFSYQDALGSELVTNGTFDSDTAWNKQTGWSIQNGYATQNGSGSFQKISQIIDTENGKIYKIKVSHVLNGVSLSIRARDTQPSGTVLSNLDVSTDGISELTFTAISNTTAIVFQNGNANIIQEIDNVSVKEYLGQEVVPDSGCGSWLWEPQSTNLFLQSEIFTSWNGYQATSNTTASPDGNSVLFLDFEDVRMFPTTTISSSTEYTSSIYLKANKVADVKFRNAAGQDTVISLTTNWVRYELTATSNSTATNALLIDARFSQGLGRKWFRNCLMGRTD